MERLERQTRLWTAFYNAHSIPCCTFTKNTENSSRSIFECETSRHKFISLPPPPFLIPAILETLKTSERFADVTEVIPGEADLYCAKYTKIHGGVVITGDSDLLVHDLGSDGAVSFFSDIELCSDDQPQCLRTKLYQTTFISQRLGLPKSHGLLSLAFEMSLDHHSTFPKLVSQATSLKAIKLWGSIYEAFCKEYISRTEEVGVIVPAPSGLQYLDPRESELVLQFPTLAKLCGHGGISGSRGQDAPRMFLPFLLDCPVRSSAWEISVSVRQLAYGLLNLIVPEDQRCCTILEHRRQQARSGGREWQLPSVPQIPGACIALLSRLTHLEESIPKAPREDLWLAFMVCQEIEWSTSLDKTPLTQIVNDQLLDLEDPTQSSIKCTWDIVHFIAQIQGSYYSLRILKHITGLLMSLDDGPLLPDVVGQLSSRLKSLPGLCEISGLSQVGSLYQRIENTYLLNLAYDIIGIERHQSVPSAEVVSKASRRKRERTGSTGIFGQSIVESELTNAFELLGEE